MITKPGGLPLLHFFWPLLYSLIALSATSIIINIAAAAIHRQEEITLWPVPSAALLFSCTFRQYNQVTKINVVLYLYSVHRVFLDSLPEIALLVFVVISPHITPQRAVTRTIGSLVETEKTRLGVAAATTTVTSPK